jgi:hypothetical protein
MPGTKGHELEGMRRFAEWRAAPVGHLWRTTEDICAPGKADWERALKIASAEVTDDVGGTSR